MDSKLSEMLARQQNLAQELKRVREEEMALRKAILAKAFPGGKIGTNTLELGNGYKLKGVFKIDRKIDEATLQVTLKQLRERGVPTDELVRWKPELAARTYNKLTDADKLIMDGTLVVKPASPSLEVVPPKESK